MFKNSCLWNDINYALSKHFFPQKGPVLPFFNAFLHTQRSKTIAAQSSPCCILPLGEGSPAPRKQNNTHFTPSFCHLLLPDQAALRGQCPCHWRWGSQLGQRYVRGSQREASVPAYINQYKTHVVQSWERLWLPKQSQIQPGTTAIFVCWGLSWGIEWYWGG